MDYVVKRDGRRTEFNENKIVNAIFKAASSVGGKDLVQAEELACKVTMLLEEKFATNYPTVEDVQDMVEKVLIDAGHVKTAKAYILFRANRTRAREMDTALMHSYEDLTFSHSKDCDTKRENANINTDTAMGTMLKYGSEGAKAFNCMYILDPAQAKAHETGDIHIHDLDFYSLTETCSQITIGDLLSRGFSTGHGFLRPPTSINTAAAQTCIAIQSNQNDQHGGQSIWDFDYGLAPYVARSYISEIVNHIEDCFEEFDTSEGKKVLAELKDELLGYWNEYKVILDEGGTKFVRDCIIKYVTGIKEKELERVLKKAMLATDRLTYQAMEAVIHNLNTMQSRAGSQTPFSSVNLGTCTSEEGRMIIKNFLLATEAGLGHGETAIFPVSVFKVKEGVNYNPSDKNYDLFKLAMKVSAKRLFPNFVFVDAPFNLQYYKEGKPETEIATMGCVAEDEVITYTIDSVPYMEDFKTAFDRVSKLADIQHGGKANYVDTSNLNICVADTNKSAYTKVLKFIKNDSVSEWAKITFSGGRTLIATLDHPLPVIKGDNTQARTYVKDLVVGDRVPLVYTAPFYFDITAEANKSTNAGYKWCSAEIPVLSAIAAKGFCKDNKITLTLNSEKFLTIPVGHYTSGDILSEVENLLKTTNTPVSSMDVFAKRCGLTCYADFFASVNNIEDCEILDIIVELVSSCFNIFNTDFTLDCELIGDMYRVTLVIDDSSRVIQTTLGMTDDITDTNRKLPEMFVSHLNSVTDALLMSGVFMTLLGNWSKNIINDGDLVWVGKVQNKTFAIQLMNLIQANGCPCEVHEVDNNTYVIEAYHFVNQEAYKAEESGTIESIELLSITQDSYDVETESDRFDVSGICSHNCRTRVIGNVYDPDRQIVAGRGNLSFTSINLPRLAIEAHGDIDKFFNSLDDMMTLVVKQLLDRFNVQCQKFVYNYPMLMQQGVWIDSINLKSTDSVAEVLKHGTLAIGFIGLAECLVALTGKHHGESEESQQLGLRIVKYMRDRTDMESQKRHLNFGIIGTPAEGLSGRFLRIDKQRYGVIPGVTDKDWYTNSSHVPVEYQISAYKKIQIEAPYHDLENGGHICYVELDGDTTNNLSAFEAVVRAMKEAGVGYGAINHPVDRCRVCGYHGIINETCPQCGALGNDVNIARIRRITGYLVGTLDRFNNAKRAEEHARVKHGMQK